MSSNFKIASLFSGCGGMDLGAEGGFRFINKIYKRLPTKTVYALDFDKNAVELYNENFKNRCILGDICNVQANEIPDHDILTGGFPCQSFSIVAQNPKRLGYKDQKGQLFFEMCRILKEKKPKAFIAENVKGILSANNKEAFPLIINEFENSGYHVTFKLLNASHFGVPQKRERVFIVGFRSEKAARSFAFPSPVTLQIPVPLKKVVDQENLIDQKYYFSKKAVDGLKKTKNLNTMNKGRVQNLDSPCNTVGAHLAKVSLNSTDPILCINNKYRMFTPREVARIQSFPERYKLQLSKTALYRALGNAVPPVLMWYVTKNVIEALKSVSRTPIDNY